MVKPPAVGDLVHVVFLDHAENASDALRFEVFGRLMETTKTAYKIRAWGYVSDTDRAADTRDDNENWYAIVRRAVESIKVLR